MSPISNEIPKHKNNFETLDHFELTAISSVFTILYFTLKFIAKCLILYNTDMLGCVKYF